MGRLPAHEGTSPSARVSTGRIQGRRHRPIGYGLPVSSSFDVDLRREGQSHTGEFRIEVLKGPKLAQEGFWPTLEANQGVP